MVQRGLLPDFSGAVMAEADDVETTLRRVAGCRPNVLVLDLKMPGEQSLPAIARIRDSAPETAIVVLTMQDGLESAREALQAGALGATGRRGLPCRSRGGARIHRGAPQARGNG